jgi:hypothetical protein
MAAFERAYTAFLTNTSLIISSTPQADDSLLTIRSTWPIDKDERLQGVELISLQVASGEELESELRHRGLDWWLVCCGGVLGMRFGPARLFKV